MILGAVAAGCGSGGSTKTNTQKSASGAPTGTPIKVGVPVAMSGPYAGDGQNSLQGVQMAVAEINAKGGLLGRPLKISTYDTQDLAPERLKLAAGVLVGQDKVNVDITGWAGWGGDVTAFGNYAPVPFFHDDAQQACVDIMKKNGYKNIWMGCETEKDTGTSAWQFIHWLPYNWPNKKVAFVLSTDPWAAATYGAVAAGAKADGWTVISTDKVPFGTTSWNAVLTKIRAANPALIMFDIQSATDMLTFMQSFKLQPTNSIVSLGMGLPVREFQDAAKGKINGVVGLTDIARGYPIPPATAGEAAWSDAFAKKFGVRPGGLAGMTYTCTRAWAQAVEAVGDPTKYDEINTWLASNSFTVWDGMAPFKFDADHVNRSNYPYFGQMQGGDMKSLSYNGQAYKDYQGKTYEFQIPSWIKK